MIRLITRGRLTRDHVKGFLAAPEDREVAVKRLIEGVGGKILSFYFTTGDSDFLMVCEANDAESIIGAMMAPVAAGAVSDVTTVRAWTGPEFKVIAEKAAKAQELYRAPGRG